MFVAFCQIKNVMFVAYVMFVCLI